MKKNHYLLFLLISVFFSEMRSQENNYSKILVLIEDTFVMEQLVSLGMSIDHYEPRPNNSISFYVTQFELQSLRQEGIPFTVEIEDYTKYYAEQSLMDTDKLAQMERTPNVANGFDLGSMGGFYTYNEVVAKLDEMKQDYPDLITEKASIGTSIEGRDIWMVKISDNPNIDEAEQVAYFDAVHHAREPLSMAATINYMFWLLENYATNPQVQFLVDHREIYFVPVVNPDGYEYNRETNPEGGGLWRKNRNPNDGTCVGVDLNRNYSFAYANNNSCSSPDPCSGIYRGEGAFSEPETATVRDFLALVAPKTAFSTHSTAGSYLMPYGFDTSPPEFDIYSEWASVFLSENDYPYGVTFQMLGYTSCGTTRDYMHSEGIYGWTPEIDGNGFWPPQSTIFDLVGENVYPLFYQSWISGGFVDIQSHQLLGEAILGESFDLVAEVKNVGVGAAAVNVTVSVSSSAPGVNVSDPFSYSDVAIRSRTSNEDQPFTITLDSNFEGNFFELKITTFQDGVLNDVLEIPVYLGEKELLYFDDASSGATNWAAIGNGIPWSVVTDDAYSGTRCFGDSNDGNGMNNTLNYFELNTTFDFSGTTGPSAFFMAKYSLEEGDFVDFQLSVDNGTNWETLQSFTLNEAWKPYFINLQNYVDEPLVRLRFTMSTDASIPGDGFYFDDFEISNYSESILSNDTVGKLNNISVFPNPFTHTITVDAINANLAGSLELDLFDIRGRKMDIAINEQHGNLIVSHLDALTSGVYFLKISSDNGSSKIHKVIKL